MELMRAPHPGVLVQRDGEVLVVNLHPGQRNAGAHSKNLRGSVGKMLSVEEDVTSVKPRQSNATGAPLAAADIIKLFQRIRDESHRFAISYHSALKRQKSTQNVLEQIPGVGPKTRAKLLRKFGSVQGLRNATEAELTAIVGASLAKKIMFMVSS